MSLDALSNSNDLFNFIIFDTIAATPSNDSHRHPDSSENSLIFSDERLKPNYAVSRNKHRSSVDAEGSGIQQGKKKRKRKPKVCKNKEEAETQRMTHIAVERNRRKQMNEHLAVLRSLMPESYVQRGDQASIVGGAVEFVKELEHLLSTLEAKKLESLEKEMQEENEDSVRGKLFSSVSSGASFSQLLMHSTDQNSSKFTSKSRASSAEIEVTLIETHANLRILSRRSHRQLLKLIAGLQALRLTILHLNLTHFHPLVLYSISLKVEEGCQLRSVDDIAAAAHHMVRIIEEEEGVLLC